MEPASATPMRGRMRSMVTVCIRELCLLHLRPTTIRLLREYKPGAVSNYNGVTFSLRKQFSNSVSAHVNYTWSHNIDETSNGGLFQYGFEGNNTILGQIYPGNLRASNYGNSDYDIRHLLNADFVFQSRIP